ncbi:MAG: hypothetical protein AB7P07_06285 [Hyphomonadaceae bacterium]
MRLRTRALFAAALACCLVSPALAQTDNQRALYEVERQAGDDEQAYSFQSGGALDARTLAEGCSGYISELPDLRIEYVSSTIPLTIQANSTSDTTLVVRAPDGAFYCNDDGGAAGLNPLITIAEPLSGPYEIWIGTYGGASLSAAELRIGELYGAAPTPGPAPTEAQTPPFPRWPPPRASARADLQREIFAGEANLGGVADRLMAALRGAGNARASYYSAPGGFALVARLERIRNDARPEQGAARFVEPRAEDAFKPDDPLGFVEALFFAPEGRYRQVVFVVSDQVVGQSAWSLTSDAAGELLDEGSPRLARPYRNLAFSPSHRVTALIYEFRKQGQGEAQVTLPGRWNANTHLTRSGVLANLRR